MTTTIDRPKDLWSTMPGWGIVANLLPPEVIAARRVRVVRKLMMLALIGVVVLGILGYAYAFWQSHTASSALGAEQSRTSQLKAEQQKYANVVRMQGAVANVKTQIATLLKNDVDFPAMIDHISRQLPRGATVTQMSITLSVTNPQAAAASTQAQVLDSSGRPHIGTVTLTGQAHNLDQVATFVTEVAKVPGVVGVFPTSQQSSGGIVQFNVQMTLTDQMFSHRYATGGK